ncbi:MAG TPA: hypothetical protein PK640_07965 [Verrucomicrobiota bacterium]|nr:hypothetical protein [Verrucomicrobiota bacterium]
MLEFRSGFRLSSRLSLMAADWCDWSECGVNDLAAVVRSAVALRLFAIDACRRLPGYPTRYSSEFIVWALNWLSVDGKAS